MWTLYNISTRPQDVWSGETKILNKNDTIRMENKNLYIYMCSYLSFSNPLLLTRDDHIDKIMDNPASDRARCLERAGVSRHAGLNSSSQFFSWSWVAKICPWRVDGNNWVINWYDWTTDSNFTSIDHQHETFSSSLVQTVQLNLFSKHTRDFNNFMSEWSLSYILGWQFQPDICERRFEFSTGVWAQWWRKWNHTIWL